MPSSAARTLPGYCFHVRIVGAPKQTLLPACVGTVDMYAPDKRVVVCADGGKACFMATLLCFLGHSSSTMPGKEKIFVEIGAMWHAVLYAAAGTWAESCRRAACASSADSSADSSVDYDEIRRVMTTQALIKKTVRFLESLPV